MCLCKRYRATSRGILHAFIMCIVGRSLVSMCGVMGCSLLRPRSCMYCIPMQCNRVLFAYKGHVSMYPPPPPSPPPPHPNFARYGPGTHSQCNRVLFLGPMSCVYVPTQCNRCFEHYLCSITSKINVHLKDDHPGHIHDPQVHRTDVTALATGCSEQHVTTHPTST